MLGITEIDKIMGIDDKELYKRFCVMNGVKGIGPADITVLEGKVLPGYPFNDHSMFIYTFDGTVYFVTNPYMGDDECRKLLEKYQLDGEVLGKDASFYCPGKSNLVKVKVATYKSER